MYGIHFDPEHNLSQYQQLVNQLRKKISDGTISGGTRLLSSREMAGRLNIARGTVIEAYDQLKMEGYLQGRHGSGTYVCSKLEWNPYHRTPSIHMSPTMDVENIYQGLSFIPGMPDMELFPRRKWLSCYHEALEYAEVSDLEYAPPRGRRDLREAIARHLSESKGIQCDAAHIVITAGSSQAFSILAQLFPAPKIAMEDPLADFVYRIFQEQAASTSLIPVDSQGISVDRIPDTSLDWIYVTPTHQFPLGGTLGAERRIALLRKAQTTGAWIMEDDFDSEFRYLGKPVPPLQVMAPERVVYIGTFSKIVSPALRIGFMVLPDGLLQEVKKMKSRWDFWNEGLQQKAMALFIRQGHLGRHVARAHRAYRLKNQFLQEQIKSQLSSQWTISGATTGMHLVLNRWDEKGNPEDVSDIIEELKKKDLLLEGASAYCIADKKAHSNALLVAFAKRNRVELSQLIQAIKKLD